MAEGLRSIDQIQPGFLWNFPRLREELNWERWYRGQFDTLFPPASIDNGRSLLAWDDIIKINMPRVFSQFYEDAIMSERPVVTGTEAVIAWLAENGMQVWETHRAGRPAMEHLRQRRPDQLPRQHPSAYRQQQITFGSARLGRR